MVYFSDDQIIIRDMEQADAQAITDAEIEQGWDASVTKYHKRLEDQREGKAISLVAECAGRRLAISMYIRTVHRAHLAGKAIRRSLTLAF